MADGANISTNPSGNNNEPSGTGKKQTTEEKIPVSLEAEQAILGAILFDNEIFYRVSAYLKPEHFYDPVHELVYESCSTLINQGRLASPRLLTHSYLARRAFRKPAGGNI